jgi:hypothetical protein
LSCLQSSNQLILPGKPRLNTPLLPVQPDTVVTGREVIYCNNFHALHLIVCPYAELSNVISWKIIYFLRVSKILGLNIWVFNWFWCGKLRIIQKIIWIFHEFLPLIMLKSIHRENGPREKFELQMISNYRSSNYPSSTELHNWPIFQIVYNVSHRCL